MAVVGSLVAAGPWHGAVPNPRETDDGETVVLRTRTLALADRLTDAYKRHDASALSVLVAPDYLGSWAGMMAIDAAGA